MIGSAASLLGASEFTLALTGAGISLASGIPVFRGRAGLWGEFDPSAVASRRGLLENPAGLWEFHRKWREELSRTGPNAAHIALAEMEEILEHLVIVTQNLDGLHTAAGSRNVVEYHGNITRTRCDECGRISKADESDGERPCACGGLLRPDIVLFGEEVPEVIHEEASSAALRCDLLLLIGTSGTVAPASILARTALGAGARAIEINPESTPLSGLSRIRIRLPAEDALPRILEVLRGGTSPR